MFVCGHPVTGSEKIFEGTNSIISNSPDQNTIVSLRDIYCCITKGNLFAFLLSTICMCLSPGDLEASAIPNTNTSPEL